MAGAAAAPASACLQLSLCKHMPVRQWSHILAAARQDAHGVHAVAGSVNQLLPLQVLLAFECAAFILLQHGKQRDSKHKPTA